MRRSLLLRFSMVVGIALATGLFITFYSLMKFSSYEDGVNRVISGGQKSIILGQMIDAKLKAAQELISVSVSSEEADAAFREKILAVSDDIKSLNKESPHHNLDNILSLIQKISILKNESDEDLFVAYRNLKTAAFQLYRLAWVNKWMSVAKTIGLIVNDLDNVTYFSAEKTVSGIHSKIVGLITYVSSITMAHQSKLLLLGQLNTIKAQIVRYNDIVQRAEKLKQSRQEEIKKIASILKNYNDSQNKTTLNFIQNAHSEYLKVLIAFLMFLLFSLSWYFLAVRRFSNYLINFTQNISRQFNSWITSGGNIHAVGFTEPTPSDREHAVMFRTFDEVIRRVNTLRKEDLLVKRLLNVPFLLVNHAKHAIFWNSALSILGKIRTLDELGAVTYSSMIHFVDRWGKPVDPIEKCFEDKVEITQLALLRVGADSIAIHVVCTPVFAPDHSVEYVMVHLRDLREENKRMDREIESQLQFIKQAFYDLKAGKIPQESKDPGLRAAIEASIKMLHDYALEQKEKHSILSGQIETVWKRIAREAELKKLVFARVGQLQGELKLVQDGLKRVKNSSGSIVTSMDQIESRNKILKAEYAEVVSKGGSLSRDLLETKKIMETCLNFLNSTKEVISKLKQKEGLLLNHLENSAMLNANNSILASKKEFTPGDVLSIVDNMAQLIRQLNRSAGFIHESTTSFEQNVLELTHNLSNNLKQCHGLLANNLSIQNTIQHAAGLIDGSSKELHELYRELARLKRFSDQILLGLDGAELKAQRLTQIGAASVDLHSHLEKGFKGIFGNLAA